MKTISLIALTSAAFIATSCKDNSGTSDSNPTASTASFYLTDAPTTADYKSVLIDVASVSYATSADTTNWTTLADGAGVYDLMKLTNGSDTLLSNVMLGSDEKISQIRFQLGTNNSIILSDGTQVMLQTPSGQTSGIKINVSNPSSLAGEYSVIVDFNADRSIVARGNGTYLLKPVLRAYIAENSAAVKGNIIPADSVYKIFTITPAGDTVSTLSDNLKQNYFYLGGLKAGTYNLKAVSPSLDTTVINASLMFSPGADVNLGIVTIQ